MPESQGATEFNSAGVKPQWRGIFIDARMRRPTTGRRSSRSAAMEGHLYRCPNYLTTPRYAAEPTAAMEGHLYRCPNSQPAYPANRFPTCRNGGASL